MDTHTENDEITIRLTKDLREATKLLSEKEVRFLTDFFYQVQSSRIRAAGQIRSIAKETPRQEPVPSVLEWVTVKFGNLEDQVKAALDVYSMCRAEGTWLRSNKGIGPILAAGLLANIDISKAKTAGCVWRFAGVDPSRKWLGKAKADKLFESLKADNLEAMIAEAAQATNTSKELLQGLMRDKEGHPVMTAEALRKALARCPWNARLKRLLWLCGESFTKFSGSDDCFYGKIYLARKAYETEKNGRKEYAAQAEAKLREFRIGKGTDAYKAYSQGFLPPAHIHARSKRYASKLLVSHLHEVMHFTQFKTLPPLPFPILKIPGHSHLVDVPNMELVPGLAEARARLRP